MTVIWSYILLVIILPWSVWAKKSYIKEEREEIHFKILEPWGMGDLYKYHLYQLIEKLETSLWELAQKRCFVK